jgi:hypothetical protein
LRKEAFGLPAARRSTDEGAFPPYPFADDRRFGGRPGSLAEHHQIPVATIAKMARVNGSTKEAYFSG